MNIIDRFTRDRISRFVWGLLTIACLATLAFAAQARSRALQDQIEEARERSASHVSGVVAPMVTWVPASQELTFAYKDLYTALQAGVFSKDPSAARVRLFSSDGIVLFASDTARRVGAAQVDDPDVKAAAQGRVSSKKVIEPFTFSTAGESGVETELLQTYVPLRVPDRLSPAGAVQIDYFMDELREAARGPWPLLMWVFGALSVVCLAMTLLSLRPSVMVLGAGVRTLERVVGTREAPPGAVAPHVAEPGPQRAIELEREVAELRDQMQASREQLKQAEEAYRYLEKRLRTTQDQLAEYEGQDPAAVDERVATLEESLRKAEAEITLLRASRMDPDSAARLAEAEARAEEAAARAAEIDGLRAELMQAEARLQAAESAVAAAKAEAMSGAGGVDPGMLAALEERVEAAERRAEEAERRLIEMSNAEPHAAAEGPMTDEASDLRARLARTAARKKLGADEATVAAHGASASASAPPAAGEADSVAQLQSAVAGELRAPLNAILGLSLTLKNAVKSNEAKDLVRQLGVSAKKLDQLVADLADARKLAEGKLSLNKRLTDLDALLSRVVQEASGLDNRDVTVRVEEVAADVDPARVQQMVDALLANAVDRTTPGETIRVSLTASEDEAVIAVEDDSPAAPEIGQDLMFALKLAQLHGGNIVASTREGGGGRYQLVLPLR